MDLVIYFMPSSKENHSISFTANNNNEKSETLDGSIISREGTNISDTTSVFSHPEEFLTTDAPPGDMTSATPSWCVPGKCRGYHYTLKANERINTRCIWLTPLPE